MDEVILVGEHDQTEIDQGESLLWRENHKYYPLCCVYIGAFISLHFFKTINYRQQQYLY